jgi:hypothetical protein
MDNSSPSSSAQAFYLGGQESLSSKDILAAAIHESLGILGITEDVCLGNYLECLARRLISADSAGCLQNGDTYTAAPAVNNESNVAEIRTDGVKEDKDTTTAGVVNVTDHDNGMPNASLNGTANDEVKKADKGVEKDGGDGKSKEKEKDKEKDSGEKKDKDKDKKDKKKKEKGPLRQIYIAYKVNGLSNINAYTCTFTIDMKAFFWWKDEKLVGRAKGTIVDYSEKGLYEPHIVVSNEFELEELSSVTTIVTPETGEVKRTVSYKGTCFIQSMTLDMFPYDCQNVQVKCC